MHRLKLDSTITRLIIDSPRTTSGGAIRYLRYYLESELPSLPAHLIVELYLPKTCFPFVNHISSLRRERIKVYYLSRRESIYFQLLINIRLLISRSTALLSLDATSLAIFGNRYVLVQDLIPWAAVCNRSLTDSIKRFIQYISLRRCRTVFYSSNYSKKLIESSVRSQRGEVVHFGSPVHYDLIYKRLRSNPRGDRKAELTFCYSTSFFAYKNIPIMLLYLRKLQLFEGLNAKLSLIGIRNESHCRYIGTLAANLGLTWRIAIEHFDHFESYCSYLSQQDIALNFSTVESFGYFLVDYKSLSLPVVSVDAEYVREILGEDCMYFNLDDYSTFRDSVLSLVRQYN